MSLRPINGTAKAGASKQITLAETTSKNYTWQVKSGPGSINQSGLLKVNDDAQVDEVIEVIVVGEGIESSVSKITVVE